MKASDFSPMWLKSKTVISGLVSMGVGIYLIMHAQQESGMAFVLGGLAAIGIRQGQQTPAVPHG